VNEDEIRKLCEMIARRVTSPELDAFVSRNWGVAEQLMFGSDTDATRDAIGMLLDLVSDLTSRLGEVGYGG
jgi:hypothetical protein